MQVKIACCMQILSLQMRPPVVAVICEALLRTDGQHTAVQQKHSAVVAHRVVHERHSHIAHDVPRQIALQQLLRSDVVNMADLAKMAKMGNVENAAPLTT